MYRSSKTHHSHSEKAHGLHLRRQEWTLMNPQNADSKKIKTKTNNNVKGKQILGVLLVIFMLVSIFVLDNYVDKPRRASTATYTKPTTQKPEPYFVHDGPVDLNVLKREKRIKLCEGSRACSGVFVRYLEVFTTAIGVPTTEFYFDSPADGINRGDAMAGWVLADGYEIAIISQYNNKEWRKDGKYPEVIVSLRDPM